MHTFLGNFDASSIMNWISPDALPNPPWELITIFNFSATSATWCMEHCYCIHLARIELATFSVCG